MTSDSSTPSPPAMPEAQRNCPAGVWSKPRRLAASGPRRPLVRTLAQHPRFHRGKMIAPDSRPDGGELGLDGVACRGRHRRIGIGETVPLLEEFDGAVDEISDDSG